MNRYAIAAVYFIVSTLVLYDAYNKLVEYRVDKQVKEYNHELVTTYDVSLVNTSYVKPLKSLIDIAYNSPDLNPKIKDVISVYTSKEPLDVSVLLRGSEILQRLGDIESSFLYLKKAHVLSDRNLFLLRKVFVRAVQLNELDLALDTFKSIVLIEPYYFHKYFSTLSRLDFNFGYLVKNGIPSNPLVHEKRSKDYFYVTAMNVALSQKNSELSDAIWTRMPEEFQFQFAAGSWYLDFLRSVSNVDAYINVWEKFVGKNFISENYLNGDFEDEVLAFNPCFPSGKRKGVTWGVKEGGYKSKKGLFIEFDGKENVGLYAPSCTIKLTPGSEYELKADWRSVDLTTFSGVHLHAVLHGEKNAYVTSEPLIGNNPWQEVSMKVDVPVSSSGLVTLRVIRSKSKSLDNLIKGLVVLDNFQVHAVTENLDEY